MHFSLKNLLFLLVYGHTLRGYHSAWKVRNNLAATPIVFFLTGIATGCP